ncbi:trefoil factor 3, partial [Huso huso]
QVEPRDRVDCGFPRITETRCYERGCCFSAAISGALWCFHPKVRKNCEVQTKKRKGCGYPGISVRDCNKKGCCFDSRTVKARWCFHPPPI